ncbi:osmotic-shock protein [Sphingomonas sp. Leaf17]|uniref:YggT family protein n=1 Tax=Sphingomonas sp. Leaf17 TaxID=1735683 RepID=UPI00070202D0|nr:YggT family protein [Sphingomonas sp. Leaf17]KQM67597.1 osmotic-shock protein [Sphingomonas sp. Leaf17]
MITIIQILQVLLNLVWWVVIIDVVLSILISFNVINTQNSLVRTIWEGVEKLCQPLYRPIRRILPDFGQIDFSPAVVLLLISLIQIVLNNAARSILTGTPL